MSDQSKESIVAEIEQLGGAVQPNWSKQALERQLEALECDVRARHENLEDVSALYDRRHATVAWLAKEHQRHAGAAKRHGIKTSDVADREDLATLIRNAEADSGAPERGV